MALSEFQRFILEEKEAEFLGGLSTGSLRFDAIRRVRRLAANKARIRREVPRTVAKAPVATKPRPPIRSNIDPIEAIVARQQGTPMSIWNDLLGSLGKSISKGVQRGIETKIGGQPKIGPAVIAAGAARVLPGLGRVLTGRVATGVGIGALGATILGGGANGCPSGFHPAKDGSARCVRNRRMNFGNARAARRSVRRLKGARKLLQDIEKMMPRRPAPRARRHSEAHN